jgi:hypothetical protein
MKLKLTHEYRARVEAMLGEGKSVRAIGRALGVSHATVLSAMRKWFTVTTWPMPTEAIELTGFLIEQVAGTGVPMKTPADGLTLKRRRSIEQFAIKVCTWHEELASERGK